MVSGVWRPASRRRPVGLRLLPGCLQVIHGVADTLVGSDLENCPSTAAPKPRVHAALRTVWPWLTRTHILSSGVGDFASRNAVTHIDFIFSVFSIWVQFGGWLSGSYCKYLEGSWGPGRVEEIWLWRCSPSPDPPTVVYSRPAPCSRSLSQPSPCQTTLHPQA